MMWACSLDQLLQAEDDEGPKQFAAHVNLARIREHHLLLSSKGGTRMCQIESIKQQRLQQRLWVYILF
jgi:hypothetical protein